MKTKYIIILALTFLLAACCNIDYNTYFKNGQSGTANVEILNSKELLYINQAFFWSGDGYVWGILPFAIHLPSINLERIIPVTLGTVVYYDNDQIAYIQSVDIIPREYQQKNGSNKFLEYKGYIISKDDEEDYMKNKIKYVSDAREIFEMSISIEAGLASSELVELDSIPNRKYGLIIKNGVRVQLFNILPENYNYFVSTLSHIYIPDKKNIRNTDDVLRLF